MTLEESFHKVVESDLGSGTCRKGLQALKAEDRQRITLSHPRQCHGSADIDKAMARAHPNAARWDYVVAHDETLHFIEVHPAHTSAVSEMCNKKAWLQQWLNSADLGKLQPQKLHWIASGKFAITPNSKQSRALTQLGFRPVSRLSL